MIMIFVLHDTHFTRCFIFTTFLQKMNLELKLEKGLSSLSNPVNFFIDTHIDDIFKRNYPSIRTSIENTRNQMCGQWSREITKKDIVEYTFFLQAPVTFIWSEHGGAS